jgi:hypothetical protein
MSKTKQQSDAEAKSLQNKIGGIYTHKGSGRRVRIEQIDSNPIVDGNGDYNVLVSARVIDPTSSVNQNIVEEANFFFGTYQKAA